MPGMEMIVSAAQAIQYPPDPATSDIETMKGFFPLVFIISLKITSEAIPEPPPLSTRKTIAFTLLSSRAFLIASEMVSDPMTSPRRNSLPLFPELMKPVAKMTAILGGIAQLYL